MAATVMNVSSPSLARNLSRMELVVSVAIMALLLGLFLSRMSALEAAAERAVLRARYQDMQSRLMTLKTEWMLREVPARRLTLDDLARHLGRGEVLMAATAAAVDWAIVPPGGWVYLRDSGEFHYRVINAERIATGPGDPPRVRFELEPAFADSNGDGHYDPPAETLYGARLRLLDTAALAPP